MLLLSPLPAEVKVSILEAVASSSLDSLYILAELDHDCQILFATNEHRLLLQASKSQIGVPEYKWALCVAAMTIKFDGTGGQNMLSAADFKEIMEDASNDFAMRGIYRELVELALRVDKLTIQYLGEIEYLEHVYFRLFAHFFYLGTYSPDMDVGAEIQRMVVGFLGLERSPRTKSPLVDAAIHLRDMTHSNPTINAALQILWRDSEEREGEADELDNQSLSSGDEYENEWDWKHESDGLEGCLSLEPMPPTFIIRLSLGRLTAWDKWFMDRKIDRSLKQLDEECFGQDFLWEYGALHEGDEALAKKRLAGIMSMPAEIKLALLKTAAFQSIRSLHVLTATNKCFHNVFTANEHTLSITALKGHVRTGPAEWKWAFCVGLLVHYHTFYDPTEISCAAELEYIINGANYESKAPENKSMFRISRDNRKVLELAFKATDLVWANIKLNYYDSEDEDEDDYSSNEDLEPEPEAIYYRLIAHFATVNPLVRDPLKDAGLSDAVCNLLGLDKPPHVKRVLFSPLRYMWTISHTNPKTQHFFECHLDADDRMAFMDSALDDESITGPLLVRLRFKYLHTLDYQHMDDVIDEFLEVKAMIEDQLAEEERRIELSQEKRELERRRREESLRRWRGWQAWRK